MINSVSHFWILLLLFIVSPQGTVLKIQVQSCRKSIADRILGQECLTFSCFDMKCELSLKSFKQ